MDIAFVNVLITVLTLLCMSSLELSNMYAIVRTFLIDSYLTAFRQALAACHLMLWKTGNQHLIEISMWGLHLYINGPAKSI